MLENTSATCVFEVTGNRHHPFFGRCPRGVPLQTAPREGRRRRFQSILSPAQDCSTQSCCQRRIAPLNPVVRAQDCPDAAQAARAWSCSCRAQPCDGAGPAVELPGLRHVVDAQGEGQKSASRSSKWKAMCHSSSCCDLGRCREDRHRCSAGEPGRAERVDRPARPGIARSHFSEAVADAARCSASAAAAV